MLPGESLPPARTLKGTGGGNRRGNHCCCRGCPGGSCCGGPSDSEGNTGEKAPPEPPGVAMGKVGIPAPKIADAHPHPLRQDAKAHEAGAMTGLADLIPTGDGSAAEARGCWRRGPRHPPGGDGRRGRALRRGSGWRAADRVCGNSRSRAWPAPRGKQMRWWNGKRLMARQAVVSMPWRIESWRTIRSQFARRKMSNGGRTSLGKRNVACQLESQVTLQQLTMPKRAMTAAPPHDGGCRPLALNPAPSKEKRKVIGLLR